jgi:hypothetical protein
MKKISSVLVKLLVVCSMVFWLSACGDNDDDDGGSADDGLSSASMDQSTAENALTLAMRAGDLSDVSWSWLDHVYYLSVGPNTEGAITMADWALKSIKEALDAGTVAREQDGTRAAIPSGTMTCDDSGSVDVELGWTGSEDPADVCDVSDLTATLSFHECTENGETVNGTVQLLVGGDLCEPQTMSVSFKQFGIIYSSGNTKVSCGEFRLAMNDIQVNTDNGELTHVTAAMNGDIAVDAVSAEYFQYAEDITVDGNDNEINISGSLTGACLDGWVTITTLSPILYNDNETCPTGGSLRLSGTSDITATFNNDGSLVIGEEEYASCENLPETCQ